MSGPEPENVGSTVLVCGASELTYGGTSVGCIHTYPGLCADQGFKSEPEIWVLAPEPWLNGNKLPLPYIYVSNK